MTKCTLAIGTKKRTNNSHIKLTFKSVVVVVRWKIGFSMKQQTAAKAEVKVDKRQKLRRRAKETKSVPLLLLYFHFRWSQWRRLK